MKTYIKNGRKFVKSRDGHSYNYKVVVVTALTTFVVSALLLVIGAILIISEPTQNDMTMFMITMVVKTIVGFGLCYAGYKVSNMFVNIMKKF